MFEEVTGALVGTVKLSFDRITTCLHLIQMTLKLTQFLKTTDFTQLTPTQLTRQLLTSFNSPNASKNSLLPFAILASTSFLSPPRLNPSAIGLSPPSCPPPPSRSCSISSSPSVSRAARVPESSRWEERRRLTLRWSGLRIEEEEDEEGGSVDEVEGNMWDEGGNEGEGRGNGVMVDMT